MHTEVLRFPEQRSTLTGTMTPTHSRTVEAPPLLEASQPSVEQVLRQSPFEFAETSELAQGVLKIGSTKIVSRAVTVSSTISAKVGVQRSK